MDRQLSYLIVGNGIAGITAAEVLRSHNPTCAITLIANELYPAYYRPALKDYLAGRISEEKLWARPSTFYREQRIHFVPGHVVGIHAAQQLVQLHNGQLLRYDELLLAHGARPRQLSCPGLDLAGVTTLRTVNDYQQMLHRLAHVQRIVVCGSGTLALETAETLSQQGYQVTHLLRRQILWSEILDATASDLVLQEERHLGIDVRTEEEITEIVGKQRQVAGVRTTKGAFIPCEMVVIAIGIEPLIDFVQASGIACQRGILVDSQMRTNLPHIYAAGDVVETTDPLTGRARVIGQWYPAIQQAQLAAYSMLGYPPQPVQVNNFYNATLLCGLEFASIGVTILPPSAGCQEIVAEPQPRTYRKVLLYQGIPIGALFLGARGQAPAFKRAIDHRINLQPVVARLFSEDFDLDAWLDSQGVPPLAGSVVAPDLSSRRRARPVTAGRASRASLVLIPHPQVAVSLREIPLHLAQGQVLQLGRQQGTGVFIDHQSISRRHAALRFMDGQYQICDIGSANGTYINNARLPTGQVAVLQPDDTIRFGDVRFRFEISGTQQVEGSAHREDVRTLPGERVQFEIDMCIGCDRCMDACPLPLSSKVTIAELNHATLAAEIAPHVARFAQECILCGSCVPVCPVDNHRDLLMISLKQRLGASWEGALNELHLAYMLPAGWNLPTLIGHLRMQHVFSDPGLVPDNYLLHLVAASQFLSLPPGEVVIREGEYGRDLYLILNGTLALSATGADNREFQVALLQPGEFTGEHGMLSGQPYPMTARAQTAALLLRVPEQAMLRLVELVPQVRTFFEQANATHSLKSILKRLALFQGVPDEPLQYIIGQTRVRQYDRDEQLFAEEGSSQPARETLHILLEGFVKVARHKLVDGQLSERIIAYRQAGDYFAGGLDLLGDSRAVTVTSINRTRVAEVPQSAVQMLFRHFPEVEQRFTARLQQYIASSVSTQTSILPAVASSVNVSPADAAHKAGLHALVSDGVVEGTDVLVIDLDRCIHCAECEAACARRHGHSRMNRKGMVIGNISITTTCRHCQDPVCMLCSRAGIARLPDGEVYITESCIGCGICAERCPYGAISIVDAVDAGEDSEEEPAAWQRFTAIFTKGLVRERKRPALPVFNGRLAPPQGQHVAPGPLDATRPRDAYGELRKKLAIKCDLCAGYHDQACVQACPTGAAFRVKPTAFFGSTEEILQR
ncbi:MAG: FAD-dependent oxidoreductase [Ktedonobacteraceae bacterium]|nr:FAD-dependent oxidoreductase [Ktedonobacteraceae bacterium]